MSQDRTVSNCQASREIQVATELALGNDSVAQALKYARQEVVKAQIQCARAKRAKSSLNLQETTLLEDELRWTRLAKAMAAENEQEALDCLAHRVRCRVRLNRIRERLLVYEVLESRLHTDFQNCISRLESLAEHGAEPGDHRNVANALQAIESVTTTQHSETD